MPKKKKIQDEFEKFQEGDYEFYATDVKKDFGDKAIIPASELSNPVANFTGSLGLDINLIVPSPEGRIVEIYGPEGSRKTSLSLEFLGSAQSVGKQVAYVDVEKTLDRSLVDTIRTLDVDKTDLNGHPTFSILRGSTGEDYSNIAARFVAQFPGSVIVIDSVDALRPEAELHGNIGDATIGKHAKLMSDVCRKLNDIVTRTRATVIFINQVREKMTMYGDPTTTTGGRGLRFYAAQRIQLMPRRKDDIINDVDGNIIGAHVRYKIIKNKLAPDNIEGSIPFKNGFGIWRELELATLLKDLSIVETGGRGGSLLRLKDLEGNDMQPLGVVRIAALFEADLDLYNHYRKLVMDNFFSEI